MSLTNIKTNTEQCLNDIYSSLEKKEAVMPDNKNLVNVANTIESIKSGGGPKFIDYIESTGTQYIDTGFKPNNNTSIEMKVLIPNSQSGKTVRFFEVRNIAGEVREAFGILSFDDSNKILQYRFNIAKNANSNSQLKTETEYEIKTNKNELYVNNELMVAITPNAFQSIFNLKLFAYEAPSDFHTNTCVYRLYSFKMYDGDILIRNFKPCIDHNGVYCLYDLVEGRYYYNQGTGSFSGEGIPTQQVNYKMLYDGSLGEAGASGANVCADVTGGFTANSVIDSGYGKGTVTFDSTHIKLYAERTTSQNVQTTFATNNSFSVDGYNKIAVLSKTTGDEIDINTYCSQYIMQNNVPSSGSKGEFYGIFSSGTLANNSSLIGNKIFRDREISNVTQKIYYYNGYISAAKLNASISQEIYAAFLLKQDNWQELCNIAGLNSSDYTSEETLCANSTAISTILSSKEAVEYIIYNCTGSFMYYFIRNTDCLTALNNSTYKTLIQVNEHWNKFLNMVA